MKSKREHVKVWVRTKPTTEFASNLLNVPSDLKVLFVHYTSKWLYFIIIHLIIYFPDCKLARTSRSQTWADKQSSVRLVF